MYIDMSWSKDTVRSVTAVTSVISAVILLCMLSWTDYHGMWESHAPDGVDNEYYWLKKPSDIDQNLRGCWSKVNKNDPFHSWLLMLLWFALIWTNKTLTMMIIIYWCVYILLINKIMNIIINMDIQSCYWTPSRKWVEPPTEADSIIMIQS